MKKYLFLTILISSSAYGFSFRFNFMYKAKSLPNIVCASSFCYESFSSTLKVGDSARTQLYRSPNCFNNTAVIVSSRYTCALPLSGGAENTNVWYLGIDTTCQATTKYRYYLSYINTNCVKFD